MKIYLIVTLSEATDNDIEICYRKTLFFTKEKAFMSAKRLKERCVVLEYELATSWAVEPTKENKLDSASE